jgi:hypothetical protein
MEPPPRARAFDRSASRDRSARRGWRVNGSASQWTGRDGRGDDLLDGLARQRIL